MNSVNYEARLAISSVLRAGWAVGHGFGSAWASSGGPW